MLQADTGVAWSAHPARLELARGTTSPACDTLVIEIVADTWLLSLQHLSSQSQACNVVQQDSARAYRDAEVQDESPAWHHKSSIDSVRLLL